MFIDSEDPIFTSAQIRTRELSDEDRVATSPRSRKLLDQILDENERLAGIIFSSETINQFHDKLKDWALEVISENSNALSYYRFETTGREALEKLRWRDYAAIRILDYIDNAGREVEDLNLHGEPVIINPFQILWLGAKAGIGGGHYNFYMDMLKLFRQLNDELPGPQADPELIRTWMDRHPTGLDERVIEARKHNRNRIINVFIKKMNEGTLSDPTFKFDEGMTEKEKYFKMLEWWDDRLFHLRFAIREPGLLNECLDFSLSKETMEVLDEGIKAGIPIFINPYYLSLLIIHVPDIPIGADLPIRDYVFNSRELVREFGKIPAWEKEDVVEPGKPNAAGWLLPSHYNIHRRYPEVAILIPDTVGRACGGLCVSCQRMFDFQNGNLNFDLRSLKPEGSWWERLEGLMKYFEEDSQLRDILITGGDALMSSDKSLKRILDAIYQMALNKIESNKLRKDGEKYAEMLRVRIGTRLPVYLPQRMTSELQEILAEFKDKASKIGFRQFVIQTHFESAMEITPEVVKGIKTLLDAGWIVTNQQVFTSAASRRGHTGNLRKALNDIGVLPYYTFSVKGYLENYNNFATNARAMQEQAEEKIIGTIPADLYPDIARLPDDPEHMVEKLKKLREKTGAPFLATDRNVLNLPGVGKSLTFRVIGITRYGRRILEFDHDHNRVHSPIIEKMGKIVIVESKPIEELINQYIRMGEDPAEYLSVFGYSLGETEMRMPVYEYPSYSFQNTDKITNIEI